jgi:DNA-binding transcriptional ArsR family regulator
MAKRVYHLQLRKNGACYGHMGPYASKSAAQADAKAVKNPGIEVLVVPGLPPFYRKTRNAGGKLTFMGFEDPHAQRREAESMIEKAIHRAADPDTDIGFVYDTDGSYLSMEYLNQAHTRAIGMPKRVYLEGLTQAKLNKIWAAFIEDYPASRNRNNSPKPSYSVVLQEKPPGGHWRAMHEVEYGTTSLESALLTAEREANERAREEQGGWQYRTAVYKSRKTDGQPSARPLKTFRPKKGRSNPSRKRNADPDHLLRGVLHALEFGGSVPAQGGKFDEMVAYLQTTPGVLRRVLEYGEMSGKLRRTEKGWAVAKRANRSNPSPGDYLRPCETKLSAAIEGQVIKILKGKKYKGIENVRKDTHSFHNEKTPSFGITFRHRGEDYFLSIVAKGDPTYGGYRGWASTSPDGAAEVKVQRTPLGSTFESGWPEDLWEKLDVKVDGRNDGKWMGRSIVNAIPRRFTDNWKTQNPWKTKRLKRLSNPSRYQSPAAGSKNARYLDGLPASQKRRILKHLADHYGVSVAEIEDEVKDPEAEYLFEYTATDRAMTMEIYNAFKQRGLITNKGRKPKRNMRVITGPYDLDAPPPLLPLYASQDVLLANLADTSAAEIKRGTALMFFSMDGRTYGFKTTKGMTKEAVRFRIMEATHPRDLLLYDIGEPSKAEWDRLKAQGTGEDRPQGGRVLPFRKTNPRKRWSLHKRYSHQWSAENSYTGAVVLGSPAEFRRVAWAKRHGVPKYIVAQAKAR